MDVDAFVREHQAAWDRLASLASTAAVSAKRLDPTEVDELVTLYEEASAHLSYARTHLADPGLVGRLTRVVATANAAIYGSRRRTGQAIGRFFTETFPAAVWHHRCFVGVATLLLFVPGLAIGIWIGVSDRALEASAPEAVRTAYLENDFEAYYSSEPAAQFASEVFINNVQVAILAFALGVTLCLGTAYVLVFNGANLGFALGLFTAAGRWQVFWGLILPHGLLELAAIVVAGGAGLALGWSIVSPGDRPRGTALAEEGQRSVTIVLGLILAFGVAGAIEGFVTGTSLPTWNRIGIGAVAFGGFALWVLLLGPRAAERGLTGRLGEEPVEAEPQMRPVALSSR